VSAVTFAAPQGFPGQFPTPPPKRRSGLLVAGLVLTVVGILALVVGFGLTIFDVVDRATEGGARRDAIVEVPVPGVATIELDDGSYVAMALGDGLVTARLDQVRDLVEAVRGNFADPVITIVGPDGVALAATTPSVQTLEDRPGTDTASVAQFRVVTPGQHTIEVASGSPGGGGPVTAVILTEADGLSAFGVSEGLAAGVILLFVGGAALTLGVVLVVIGIVRRNLGSTIR
jgi:hypothetical protein